MKERESIGFQQALELEQEMLLEPEAVLTHIRPLEGFYGTRTVDDFVFSLESSLVRYRRPHIIVFIAEPLSGKSHLSRDILARLWGKEIKRTINGREIKRKNRLPEIEEAGEKITVDGIYWGDVISLAKLAGAIDKDKIFGSLDEKDIKAATQKLRGLLVDEIRENKNKRKLIVVEVPAVTGAWIKEEFVGVDRGLRVLWDLAKRKGIFNSLMYETYWVGVVAHPSIRKHAMEARREMEKSFQSPSKVAEILRNSGEVITSYREEDIKRYGHESPNPASIVLIANQADNLAIQASEAGWFSLDFDKFKFDEEYRAEAIGKLIRGILSRNLGVRKHVFIGYNIFKLESLAFNLSVPVNNLIWQLYPEVESVVNK